MNKFDTMPERIIDERERTQCIGELRNCITSMQSSVKALASVSDFSVPSSAELADWQQALAAVDKRRDEALQAIETNVILTQEGKATAAKEWKQWRKVIAAHVNAIVKNLTTWTEASWKWDEIVQNIVPGRDTVSIATEKSMKAVPKEAGEHAELIEGVRKAVLTLRTWEDRNDVGRVSLERLLNMNTEELATMWATGAAKVNHDYDDPHTISVRRVMRERIV